MMRLQKLLAQHGVASRRQAEALIRARRVLVNGQVATIGDHASKDDIIMVDHQVVGTKPELVYYLLNKPQHVVSTAHDPHDRPTVVSLIKTPARIFPVGRLDFDTTGVLLLTNDGELTFRLTHPSYQIQRTYQAELNRSLTTQELDFLNSKHVKINGKAARQDVMKLTARCYHVTTHQGTYHHLKYLFETVGAKVVKLHRIAYGPITDRNLAIGSFRRLNVKEVRQLKLLTRLL